MNYVRNRQAIQGISRTSAAMFSTAALMLATGACANAMAQEWPSKPIRIIVSFPPGSPGDVASRIVGDKLGQALKQSVIIDNRPGAGGNIGADVVAKSAPDGYTILEGPDTLLTVNPHIYKKLSFKVDDLVPLTYLANFNQMLVCNPTVPVKNVSELIDLANKQTLNYASGGAGVPGHLAMELFMAMTDVKMSHVAYKGPSPAAQDLLGGQVPCGYLASPVVAPHVKSGKLVGLAVSGSLRSVLVPHVPTMVEAGVKGYDASFGEVLFVPKGTPDTITKRLNEEIAKIVRMPEVKERLHANDLEPMGNSSAEASQQVKAGYAKWGEVVKRINLRVD